MTNKVTYNIFKKNFWTWENLLNKQKFRDVKQKHGEGMEKVREQREKEKR